MNNDWKKILEEVNEVLSRHGISIRIEPDEEEIYYDLIITCADGNEVEYASNYFEHELVDLIYDAEQHIIKSL